MAYQEALDAASQHDEEAWLISRAQEADRAAWDEIFQRHYRRVLVFVYCRVGETASAEDIASEVFIEAWKGIRGFRYNGTPFISWLYRIAHNLLADFHRKRGRNGAHPLGDNEGRVPDPRDEAEHVAVWQSVAAALRKLTLEQQQVLVSRFMEGLSINETAQRLGKKENAVKQLEFRALKSVRRILAGAGVGRAEPGWA